MREQENLASEQTFASRGYYDADWGQKIEKRVYKSEIGAYKRSSSANETEVAAPFSAGNARVIYATVSSFRARGPTAPPRGARIGTRGVESARQDTPCWSIGSPARFAAQD